MKHIEERRVERHLERIGEYNKMFEKLNQEFLNTRPWQIFKREKILNKMECINDQFEHYNSITRMTDMKNDPVAIQVERDTDVAVAAKKLEDHNVNLMYQDDNNTWVPLKPRDIMQSAFERAVEIVKKKRPRRHTLDRTGYCPTCGEWVCPTDVEADFADDIIQALKSSVEKIKENERLKYQLSCCQEALADAIAANTQANVSEPVQKALELDCPHGNNPHGCGKCFVEWKERKAEHKFPGLRWDEGCEKCGGFEGEPCDPPVVKETPADLNTESHNESSEPSVWEDFFERFVGTTGVLMGTGLGVKSWLRSRILADLQELEVGEKRPVHFTDAQADLKQNLVDAELQADAYNAAARQINAKIKEVKERYGA